MKYRFLILFLVILSVCSCKRSAEIDKSKDREALFLRFHGKYKILSSVADQAVDLNLDGLASVELRDEMPELIDCNLEIRIPKQSSQNSFNEFWPEPYFEGLAGASPTTYNPNVTIMYARQGVTRTFQFSSDIKTILLHPDENGINQQRHTRPSEVNILAGDVIEIIKTKRFYTSSGWKEVRVVTQYERYTMTT